MARANAVHPTRRITQQYAVVLVADDMVVSLGELWMFDVVVELLSAGHLLQLEIRPSGHRLTGSEGCKGLASGDVFSRTIGNLLRLHSLLSDGVVSRRDACVVDVELLGLDSPEYSDMSTTDDSSDSMELAVSERGVAREVMHGRVYGRA